MEEWATYKLGEIAECSLGKMLDQRKNKGKPRTYLGNVAVRWGSFNIDPTQTMLFEDHELEKYSLKKNDIVICEGGEPGRCAIWKSNDTILIQKALHRVRVNAEIADPLYVYYYITHLAKSHQLEPLFTGSTIKHLPRERLVSIEIRLPDLSIQKQISSILATIDDKRYTNSLINDNLEQQVQALYKSWFIDFEPFKDGKFIDSELGIIPEGWKILPLSSLGTIICGKTPSKSNKDFYDGNIPFIKIPDMHNKIFVSNSEDHLSDLGVNSQRNKTIPPYSILVSCIATVGLVCINTKVCQTNQQINTLIPYEDSYRIYLFLFLKSLREQLITLGSGGTTTLNVNTSQFSNLKIIVPDTKSLKAFSSIAESLFQRINNNCDTNYMLSNLRDMILPKLMTGELKINDLDC